MRLDKILNAVIPGMYDTPCKIAIFTNGRKIKVFEKTCFRSLDFNTPVPQNWVRNYNLEKFKSAPALAHGQETHKKVKSTMRKTLSPRAGIWNIPVWISRKRPGPSI